MTSKPSIDPSVDIDISDLLADDSRLTLPFQRAVDPRMGPSGVIVIARPLPDVERPRVDRERAARLTSDVAQSADEAARFEHRRRVVAPLLMLLALGLLFAAGRWSC